MICLLPPLKGRVIKGGWIRKTLASHKQIQLQSQCNTCRRVNEAQLNEQPLLSTSQFYYHYSNVLSSYFIRSPDNKTDTLIIRIRITMCLRTRIEILLCYFPITVHCRLIHIPPVVRITLNPSSLMSILSWANQRHQPQWLGQIDSSLTVPPPHTVVEWRDN